jgi:hypothetical protein
MATSIARRQFTSALVGAAVAWPLAVLGGQAGGRRRLGVLVGLAKGDPESERWLKALLERLAQLGWTTDKNLEIDLRWSGMELDQIKEATNELVEARLDLPPLGNSAHSSSAGTRHRLHGRAKVVLR